jgi:hypothetical protein
MEYRTLVSNYDAAIDKAISKLSKNIKMPRKQDYVLFITRVYAKEQMVRLGSN